MAPPIDLQDLIDDMELQTYWNLIHFGILIFIGSMLYFGWRSMTALLRRRRQPTSKNDDPFSYPIVYMDVNVLVDDHLEAERNYAAHLTTKGLKKRALNN